MLEGILISYKHGNLLNEKIFCIWNVFSFVSGFVNQY
jgi:hypothetical protein